MAHAALREAREAAKLRERADRVRRALNTVHPARRFDRLDGEALAALAQTLGMTVEAARDLLVDVIPDEPPVPARRRHPR